MNLSILYVDDEPDIEDLIKQQFRRKIKKGEFSFEFARDGLEALEMLQKSEFDIVLSDINMPNMDGLRLLGELSKLQIPHLKTVMITAYGDMSNLRKAMNSGAFDFINKPIDFDDLEQTIYKTAQTIAWIKDSEKRRKQLYTLEQDLEVAREIQLGLIPKTRPDLAEVELAGKMEAAKVVGGDFYDYFPIDKDHLAIVIGDVSGKGVPAAIFMALSRTIIRTLGTTTSNSAVCINEANKLLAIESVDSMFVTAFYGVLNLKTGQLNYVNAGHNPPFLIPKDQDTMELPNNTDPVLGILPHFKFTALEYQLQAGDRLFLFTDGLCDAINNENQRFNTENLLKFCQENRHLPLNDFNTKVYAKINGFMDGSEQFDDMTCLLVEFKLVGQSC